MIRGKKVLAVITARGGSKGVPRKNVREIMEKPLIVWTIEAAHQSRYIDKTILSSDDAEIIQVAEKSGCEIPFVRPAELANDTSSSLDVLKHALSCISEKYEYVVLLQPTSPLRICDDIDKCIEKCDSEEALGCVSVTPVQKSPYHMFTIHADKLMVPIMGHGNLGVRRQDLPTIYQLNGAVYVARCERVLAGCSLLEDETIPYIMPAERSIDIDSEEDLVFADMVLRMRKGVVGK